MEFFIGLIALVVIIALLHRYYANKTAEEAGQVGVVVEAVVAKAKDVADVNKDGKVDVADAKAVVNKVAKTVTKKTAPKKAPAKKPAAKPAAKKPAAKKAPAKK